MGRDEEFELYYQEVLTALGKDNKTKPDREKLEIMFLNRYTAGEAATAIRDHSERAFEDEL